MGPEIAKILNQSIDTGRHDKGNEENRRPGKDKRHQAACSILESLTKIDVGASSSGHSRAKFGPDQPVRQSQYCASNPAKYGLWPSKCCHHERNSDERPYAAHLSHVDGYCRWQFDTTYES